MAKKPIEVDVILNTEDSEQKLRDLKRALRQLPEGTADWNKVYNEIDDLEDKLKGARKGAADWIDTLEGAGGPIGLLGTSLNKAKVSFSSFNTALKASVIGIIVTAIGGLVAAFSKSEVAQKKLQPILIQFERILGGIFRALEPLLDAFIELAEDALPYITDGIGYFYSGLVSLFTLLKEAGIGAGKILKGIFTLDFDAISEGYDQLTGSWEKAVDSFKATNARYVKGTKEITATEKENAKERNDTREGELETWKKTSDAKLEKAKQEALALAKTDEERFAVEKKFQDEQFNLNKEYLNKKAGLYAKNSKERKDVEAEIIALEAERLAQQQENAKKEQEFFSASVDKRLEILREGYDKEIGLLQKTTEAKKKLYGEDSAEADAAAQEVINKRRTSNEEEKRLLDDIVAQGKTLTEEQKKRRQELNGIYEGITLDQYNLDLQVIKNTSNRNQKLNDLEVERLNKVKDNERLGYDVRIQALKNLQDELQRDRDIKIQALDDEAARRIQAGENEIEVAKYIATQKALIEKGYANEVQPLIQSTADLSIRKNQETFNSFLQLGTALSSASQLFDETSQAAKTFAAIQDLVNIAQQANIVITNLQALGILQKANAEAVNTAATMGAAAAEGTKSGAKLPFPANIVAIASIVGAIISIFATIKKLFGAKGSANIDANAKAGTAGQANTPQPYRVSARRAMGGLISGEGSSTSDSILTSLSNGEYVMNARSTQRFLPILERMNEFGRMPQFTEGTLSSIFPSRNSIVDSGVGMESNRPIKTYVVATEMSNQQQFERVIKSRSTI